MVLYHGSLDVVERPRILEGGHPTDFGRGFYTTTSSAQAHNFVLRRGRRANAGSGFLNVYEFDEAALDALDVLRFPEANHEWVDFVKRNRLEPLFTHAHDVVIGPVADDQVLKALTLFLEGEFGEQQLIAELLTYRLVDQWLFHTPRALEPLRFVQATEVTRSKDYRDD